MTTPDATEAGTSAPPHGPGRGQRGLSDGCRRSLAAGRLVGEGQDLVGWYVGQRVCLKQDHGAPARPPLRVRPGDSVTLGRTDGTWPAFIWTENSDGVGGWVPHWHVRRTGEGEAAEVIRGYDTTELSAGVGTVVEVVEVDEESGWLRCRAGDGGVGWVPVLALEPVDNAAA